MKGNIEERCVDFAIYIIEKGATVRDCAKHFGMSKSTVHKDITERLKTINHPLYIQARTVLEANKRERHMRGGLATKLKYEGLRKKIIKK